ncbi:MAG: hypothetical protein ACYDD4_09515 [Acidimicrobiales bacterium]
MERGRESGNIEDAIRRAAGDVRAAVQCLSERLQVLDATLAVGERGSPDALVQLVDTVLSGAGGVRREVLEATTDYETRMMHLRAHIARLMIDVHGMSFTAAAKQLGISRQMVARLHHVAAAPAN